MLGSEDLRALPAPDATPGDCACAHLRCAGWESIAAPLGDPLLRRLGTLRDPATDEPRYDEPPGTPAAGGIWSAAAPIDPDYAPYNRCDVWACAACGRGFLQYTEFGGYYVDHRLRQVDPTLVV